MFSLIIATYNGAKTLPRMLSALESVTPPAQGLEIIAINNASTDRTYLILENFRERLKLKILFEDRRGKSFALNRGIEAAQGELIVFTDDDVLAESDWLTHFEQAAHSHPKVGIFAGQVRHHWDSPPPNWLEHLADKGLSFAGTPSHLQEQTIGANRVKGPNFMVRRGAIGDIRFCEDDGVAFTGEKSSKGGEDTQFAAEISLQSGPPLFVPSACVKHIVRSEQIHLVPVFRRYIRIGSSIGPLECAKGRAIFGYPFWGIREAAEQGVRGLFKLASGRTSDAAEHMVHLAMMIGQLNETRKSAISRH